VRGGASISANDSGDFSHDRRVTVSQTVKLCDTPLGVRGWYGREQATGRLWIEEQWIIWVVKSFGLIGNRTLESQIGRLKR